jgi:hypothetical protein
MPPSDRVEEGAGTTSGVEDGTRSHILHPFPMTLHRAARKGKQDLQMIVTQMTQAALAMIQTTIVLVDGALEEGVDEMVRDGIRLQLEWRKLSCESTLED